MVLVFLGLVAIPEVVHAAWHDSNWQYRREITIQSSQVVSTLADFPVLIQLASDASLAAGARSDGFDILFTDDDGTTKLAHEIEDYVTGTGALVAWVKVPSLPSTVDKTLYLYYGYSSATDQGNPSGVWTEGYDAVWHWDDDFLDSADTNHGTNQGSTDIAAKFADGQSFDGSNDYVDLSVMNPNDYDDFTISAWYKSTDTSPSDDEYIFMHYGTAAYNELILGPTDDGGQVLRLGIYWNGNWEPQYGTSDIVDQQWHYLVAVRGSGRLKLWVDGTKERDVADPRSGLTHTLNTTGPYSGDDPGNTEQVHGIVDELRISTTGRSDGWVQTEFNNQNAPGSFFSLGAEEVPTYAISGTVFEDVDFAGTASAYDGGTTDALIDSVDVELYDADNADAFVASTSTGRTAAGTFSFDGLADGNYKVRVRSATIGDTDSSPAGGLSGTVPATWPYPLPELSWADGAPLYGGQSATVDDTDTADDTGPGDTYVSVSVSGADVTNVDFGFAYNLIVNTSDDGLAAATRSDQGSLRQFIKNTNAIGTVGGTTANSSQFRMQVATNRSSGAESWWRITPANALPSVADGGAALDGSTQRINSGTDSNTLGPEIELYGASAGGSNGLRLTAGTSTVRELAIGSFGVDAIDISGGFAHTIAGSYLGTDATGVVDLGNTNDGIDVAGADSCVIGGIYANDRNVIANNDNEGINFSGATTTGNTVIGNYIGLAADGTTAAGNGDVGVAILSGSNGNTIGGPTVPERNIISMNFEGIEIGSSNNTVRGNYIGTDKDGAQDRGHTSSDAVEIINSVSGNTIEGNLIAFTKAGFHGVSVQGGTGTAVLGNQIHSNTGLGINLGTNGVNTNDGAKSGGQPNLLMDHPVFTEVLLSGTILTVTGYVGSAPGQSTFANARVEIFESDDDGTGFGEGKTYLGFLTSDANGNFEGAVDVSGKGLVVGEKVTGTATDGSDNTSEFGANFVVAPAYIVAGTVFEDVDFAGTASAYDGGVADALLDSVDVELYDADNSDAFIASTATGRTAAGAFSFAGLTNGNYKVRVRSATIGDADSPPAGGLNGTVPATWPYPLPEMIWGNGSALYGGQDATIDDADTGDDAGPGDTYVAVSVSGTDVTGVEIGFAYNLVVNTLDDGLADATQSDQGSLRQFLKNANAIGTASGTTANASEFRIPNTDPGYNGTGNGEYTITVTSALPTVRDPITIDGSTHPDFGSAPIIEIDGSGILSATDGLTIKAGGSTLRSVIVGGFWQNAVVIDSLGGNTIAGCYLGLGPDGATAKANFGAGVVVRTGSNEIGGTSAGDGNVIAGNLGIGIDLSGASTTGNVIRGNKIGTDAGGTLNKGNGAAGIDIVGGANGNTIGGTLRAARNLISGNAQGISLSGPGTNGNTILGNFIGTDHTGLLDLGNSADGIFILSDASGNTVGGAVAGARNIISGNGSQGVNLDGPNTTGNQVLGNFIGVDSTGVGALPNTHEGVLLGGATHGNTVGGLNSGEGNILGFNGRDGIYATGAAVGNRFLRNSIFSNTELGIDLDPDGVGTGGGANNDKSPPVLVSVVRSGADFTVVATSTAADTLEFFRANNGAAPAVAPDGSGSGEGFLYLGRCVDNGATSGPHLAAGSDADPGNGSYEITILSSGLSSGDYVTATATAATDGTSELAVNRQPTAGTLSITGMVFEDVNFTGTASAYDGGATDALLDSVDVELYDADNSDAFVATTTTGRTATGTFAFAGLADGNYKVRVRSATIGDADSPPAGGLNGTVPATWPYPLPALAWANGSALYGGQDGAVDDTDTGDDAGPGDTYVAVSVSGADVTGVDFGFAYNLIVHTADDGLGNTLRSDQGSLRQFLKNANAIGAGGSTTANSSEFRMQAAANQSDATDSWWRITAAAALPSISDAGTILDGSRQRANGGTDSNTRGPEIEIFGNGVAASGLTISNVANSRVQELVVNGFSSYGITVTGAGGTANEIYGNYIGTDAIGEAAVTNTSSGVLLDSSTSNNDVGGVNSGEGNLISGNGAQGIQILSSGSNRVRGNTIGTDRTVTAKIPNGSNGIYLNGSATGNTIGGSAAGAENVVSGNSHAGIWADFGQTNLTIQGNTVGTGLTEAETTLGNSLTGIRVSVSAATANVHVGGEDPDEGNLVAHNGQQGLYTLNAGTGVRFVGNNVRDNGFGGIYSRSDGVLVAKNIVSGNGAGYPGIRIADEFGTAADGNEIYHNTVHGNGTDGLVVEGTGAVVRNNILTGNGAFGINLSGGAMTESHNNITDASTSPANGSGRSNVALDPTDLNVDPIYVDAPGGDFTLSECSSPSINVGLDLGGSQPDMNGGDAGLFTGIAPDQGALESTCTSLALTLMKRAFLADGTPVAHGTVLPAGTPVLFLLYINNTGPARTDVSVRDVLDTAFSYEADTIKTDASVPACIDGSCGGTEEQTIFAAVDAQTAGTDAVDGDTVSYTTGSGTVESGDASQSNAQLDIPGNTVYAVLFEVRVR